MGQEECLLSSTEDLPLFRLTARESIKEYTVAAMRE